VPVYDVKGALRNSSQVKLVLYHVMRSPPVCRIGRPGYGGLNEVYHTHTYPSSSSSSTVEEKY